MNNSLYASPSKLASKCSYYILYAATTEYIANGPRFYLEINIKKRSVNVNHESCMYLEWSALRRK